MLFKRVAQHVVAQNWTAVAIDFLIVVIGVVIGIQVSNWNDQRLDRKLEQGYLLRLHEDVLRSINRLELDTEFSRQQNRDLKVVLLALEQCQVSEDQEVQVQRAFNTMGLLGTPRFYRRTFDELSAAGRMDVISNKVLVEELATTVAEVEFYASFMPTTYRELEFHRNKVNELVYFKRDLDKPPEAGQTLWDTPVRYDIEELCRHPTLANSLSYIGVSTFQILEGSANLLVRYRHLIESIESELEQRWGTSP
jgi:hypothetical protein